MKKNKKKKKFVFVKIILVLILMGIVGVGTYYGTLYLDNQKKGGDVKMTVTFDDTESYVIPNTKKLDEELAKQEWPYMMEVKNEGDGTGLYQIIITDIEKSTIKRDNLMYLLILDDVEVSRGKLSSITSDILYQGMITGNTTQKYKLYIWSTVEPEEDAYYEYKLAFNTIKEGGPGF